MHSTAFARIADLLQRRAGIVLGSDKAYLVETRLGALLSRFGLESIEQLADILHDTAAEELQRGVVEALTTHESSFFRDGRPFEHLRTLLPRLADAKRPGEPVRIWSAACAAGQEPYSIAMLAADAFGAAAAEKVEILATDISANVLARARDGLFTQFEVQRGLPIRALMKHFVQESTHWRVKAELRRLVRFEERNLLADCAMLGQFEVIFCRNVLIYFDIETKTRVLEKLAQRLTAGGVLYLGGAETIIGLTERLMPLPDERGAFRARCRWAA